MEPGRWNRIKGILDAALECRPDERERVLDEQCIGDDELRGEVASLLAAHDAAGSIGAFFGAEDQPERVGPYRILRPIAKGGMGIVYLAEQLEPIRRQVAVKLIKIGMDTHEVVARFELERQALALMSHPYIAQVFDAGSTEEGRPYFAMEYVPGVPITEYCDKHSLDISQRLDLFLKVCDAIQHAHQKGVVHRDIKPSNILVMHREGETLPKVIDFGIAKATSVQLARQTLYTRTGVMIGTPEYISPEQAAMSEAGVDTRTDVYSLGVLLYELLTGLLPFGKSTDPDMPLDEILRRIRTEAPVRPSTRVGALGQRADPVARSRRSDTRAIANALKRDLDWIALKALEKDPTRRYASISEFAADIRRHLADEPVVARPPSAGYRTRTFVRRHRLGVAAAAVMLSGLTAGFVGSTVGLVRARRAEARALQQARAKGQVADFLKNLFKVSNPSEARGKSITARELLDKAGGSIDTQLSDQPEIKADLTAIMGDVYDNIGLYAEAELLSSRALDIRRRVLGPEHPETLRSINSLAQVLCDRGKYSEAERLFSRAIDVEKQLLGPAHPDTLRSMYNLAVVYENLGRYPEAERLQSQVLQTQERVLGAEQPETLRSMNNLANVYQSQGRYLDAERFYSRVLEIRTRVLGPEHPDTTAAMNNLALDYWREERYPEAERLYSQVLEIQNRVLGHEHPITVWAMVGMADVYQSERRYSEAARLHAQALEIRERVLGPEHSDTLGSMNALALAYSGLGRYSDAERLCSQALAIENRVLGPGHPVTLITKFNLARVSAGHRDRPAALRWLRIAVDGGYSNSQEIERAADLESLHGAEFDALIAIMRQKAAAEQLRPNKP